MFRFSRCDAMGNFWSQKSIPLGALLWLTLVSPLMAQSNPSQPSQFTLSLSEAFIKANTQNPQLKTAERNLDLSKGDITIAGATPNPQIQSQYGFGPAYSEGGNIQQVGLAQTVELGGKRDARINVANAQYRVTNLQLNALRWDIHNQVRRAYAELAAAEANAQLVDTQIALVDQLVLIARKRVEAGVAPEAELLSAQLARTQLDPQQAQAKGRIQNARIQLNGLFGEPPEANTGISDNGLFNLSVAKTELAPNPKAVLPPVEALVEQAYAQRLDLKANIQQQEVARNQIRLVDAQRIPDLQFGVGYVFTTYTNANPQTSGVATSLGITLPIFYNQNGEVAKAKATLEQTGLQIEASRRQIATNIHTSYQTLSVARKNILEYQSRILADAKEVVKLAQESYQVGKTNLSSVILAQQSAQQIRSGYLDAIVAYQGAWADLESAVGAPLNL
ncbi:MAG: TolC family protein [Gloeobacterales cyanobacterium]